MANSDPTRPALSRVVALAQEAREAGLRPYAAFDADGTLVDARAFARQIFLEWMDQYKGPDGGRIRARVGELGDMSGLDVWDAETFLRKLETPVSEGTIGNAQDYFRARFFDPRLRAEGMRPLPAAGPLLEFTREAAGAEPFVATLRHPVDDVYMDGNGQLQSSLRRTLGEPGLRVVYSPVEVNWEKGRASEPAKSTVVKIGIERGGIVVLMADNDPVHAADLAKKVNNDGVVLFVNGDLPKGCPPIETVLAGESQEIRDRVVTVGQSEISRAASKPWILDPLPGVMRRFALDAKPLGETFYWGGAETSLGVVAALAAPQIAGRVFGIDPVESPGNFYATSLAIMHTSASNAGGFLEAVHTMRETGHAAVKFGGKVFVSDSVALSGAVGAAGRIVNPIPLLTGAPGFIFGDTAANALDAGPYARVASSLTSGYLFTRAVTAAGAQFVSASAVVGSVMLVKEGATMWYEEQMGDGETTWNKILRQKVLEEPNLQMTALEWGAVFSALPSAGIFFSPEGGYHDTSLSFYLGEREQLIQRQVGELDRKYREHPEKMPFELRWQVAISSGNVEWIREVMKSAEFTDTMLLNTFKIAVENGAPDLLGLFMKMKELRDVALQIIYPDETKRSYFDNQIRMLLLLAGGDVNGAMKFAGEINKQFPFQSDHENFWSEAQRLSKLVGVSVPHGLPAVPGGKLSEEERERLKTARILRTADWFGLD